MVHLHYLTKDPTTKIKTKKMKQLKVLNDNENIGNKLYYYLKSTDSPEPRNYCQSNIHKPEVPVCPIVPYRVSPLYNLKNIWLTLWKFMLQMKITTSRILQCFPTALKKSHWKWWNNGIIWRYVLVLEHFYRWYVKYYQVLC